VNEYEITKANLECKQAELKSLKMAYDLQSKKYDSLYDAFLRMNKYNKDLSVQLQGRASRSYEDFAGKMYDDYIL
jgi:vacuolar-type H+-ATPase subunit D/Vma8